MTLRYSRPTSSNVLEHERLMENVGKNRAMYPRRYAIGRVHNDHTEGIYELYVLDTERFIHGIESGDIPEIGPIPTEEGQKFMSYPIEKIQQYGAVVHEWPGQPDNPEDIRSWA